MKRACFSAFHVLVFALMFGAGASAQSSVNGEWDGSFETPGGARPFKVVLSADGEKLTGTAKRTTGDVPIAGTIKGDAITFSYTINYSGNDLTLTYSGKVSGDTMSGTVSFGGNAEESWTAKRATAKK